MFGKETENELTGDRAGSSDHFRTTVVGDGDVWTYVIAALTSTFGILSGYALYVLWWEQDEKGESGWIFALAFAAAAVMSFAFEVLRSAIEGNKVPWSRYRVISTVVMLAAFELFIIAAHSAVEMYSDLAKIAGIIFGAQFANTVGPGLNLVALGGLWIVVALTITLKLRKFIVGWPYPNSTSRPQGSLRKYLAETEPDLRRGTLAGFSAGVFWGILSAVLYVVLFRALGLAQWIHSNPAAWAQSFDEYPTFHLPRFALMILYGPAIVAGKCAEHFGAWGLFAGVAAVSLIAYLVTPKGSRGLAAIWPPLTMLFLLGLPILADRGARRDLLSLVLLVVVIWGVPATLLGAFAPLLREPAHNPPVWGLVAAAAACVLMAVTMARILSTSVPGPTHDESVPVLLMVLTSVLLFVLAFYLFRGAWSEEFWVLMALSMGAIIFGTTTLVNKVSLYAMQKSAHYLIALPLGPAPPRDPMDEVFRNLGRRATLPRSEGGILWLLPSGVSAGPLTCDSLRAWTPEQRNQFAVNLRQTAAGDNEAAAADNTTRAEYSTQLRKLDQQVRAAVDGADKPLPGEAVSNEAPNEVVPPVSPSKMFEEIDSRFQGLASAGVAAQGLSKWAATIPNPRFDGRGQQSTDCGSDLDSPLQSLVDASAARTEAATNLRALRPSVAQDVQTNSEQLEIAWNTLRTKQETLQAIQTQHLELTMTASLGFWVTVGLLAIWRLTQPESA